MKARAVDLFAGAGGFSTGARQAGVKVLMAANHWLPAVQTHWANHPQTEHLQQDLNEVDWRKVPEHDLLLASPACQGHSRARGEERPYHDALRSTAWAVVTCAERLRPRALLVENVEEFRSWTLFPAWRLALEALGYKLTLNILDASEFGVPQARVRLFVAGRLDQAVTLKAPGIPGPAASTIIDWKEGNWSEVDKEGRALSTLRQIANGRRVHGKRFLVAFYGSEANGRSVDKPLGTVTTRERFAVVDGDRMRMLSVPEYRRAMGFPDDYRLPPDKVTAVHLLGNAVCPPVAKSCVEQLLAA